MRVHSKYSLACPWLLSWPDFLARRGATRCQSRNPLNGDSSLAKIGINLVSCSRGKWSPIDTDVSQTASATRNRLLYSQARMVLYYIFFIFAWSSCIKLEPHQLTVILGLMSTTVFSGNLLPGKPGRDRLGIRARLTIG